MLQEKVLEEQDRVRRSEERVKQQQQQQQQKAKAKQEAALAKASAEGSKRRKGPSPAPAVPDQAAANPQPAAAAVSKSVAGTLIETAQQPVTDSKPTVKAVEASSEGAAVKAGVARVAAEVTSVATPTPSPGQRLFRFGGKASHSSTPSPVPGLAYSAEGAAAQVNVMPGSNATYAAQASMASGVRSAYRNTASPVPDFGYTTGAAAAQADVMPGSNTTYSSFASPMPGPSYTADAAAAAAAHVSFKQGAEAGDTAYSQGTAMQSRASAAELSRQASMAAPLLTGSRPVLAADAAVRHGGIRSITASPLPDAAVRHGGIRSITASPLPGGMSRSASPSPGSQGLRRGSSLAKTAVGEASRPPSVLGQGNVQTALKHILQRLPAE